MANHYNWTYCDMGEVHIAAYGTAVKKHQRITLGDPVTMLIPREFGGKEKEVSLTADLELLEGGSMFNGEDAYIVLANWNRTALAEKPELLDRHAEKTSFVEEWRQYYCDLSLSPEEVTKMVADKYFGAYGAKYTVGMDGLTIYGKDIHEKDIVVWRYRNIGVIIDGMEDLPYPLKFARNADSVYEDCPASKRDPGDHFGI